MAGALALCLASAPVAARQPADPLLAKAAAIDALVLPDEALAAWTAAIAALEAERPRRALKLAEARNLRANAYINLSKTDEALADSKAALALVDASRDGRALKGAILANQGLIADTRSDWPASRDLYKQALAERQAVFGTESAEAAQSEADVGLATFKIEGAQQSLPLLEHAWGVFRKTRPPSDQPRLVAGTYLGNSLDMAGRRGEAEVLLRQLLVDGRPLGAGHPLMAQVNGQLAGSLRSQGRQRDALALYRATIATMKANGASKPVLADAEIDVAINSLQLDRPADAESYAIDAAEDYGTSGQQLSRAAALTTASNAARQLGKPQLALERATQSVALARANTPEIPLATALFRTALADAYWVNGDLKQAVATKREAYDVIVKLRPAGHGQRTNVEMAMGWMTALDGDAAKGLALYRPAFEQVAAGVRKLEVSQTRAVGATQNIESFGQGLHTAWLAKDAEFGFRIAQVMVESDAGRATLATLARLGARDAATGAKLAKRRELLAKRYDLDGQRVGRIASDAAAADALGVQIGAIDAELTPIERDLARDYPGFDTLLRPQPEVLAAVQARLATGEVLLVPVTSYHGLFTFAITRDRVAWGRSAMIRSEVRRRIERVRASILPRGSLRAGEDASGDIAVVPDFARAEAAALYAAVVTPEIAPMVAKAKLLSVAPDDVLSTIPFSLLPTGEDQRAPYLIERVAIRVVPAIAAIGRSGGRGGGSGFAGVGAPDRPAAGAADDRLTKALTGLPPLPGAADELKALGKALGPASTGVLLTGAQATEARVAGPEVARARVVAFATHGLVSGDFDMLTEPALLLTPDAAIKGTAGDGLFTASEAAALKLDADWVVLSACNTASGDTLSAAGYAGLARAFLFAGGRQVLASHWPVRDDVSARLTVATIKAQAQGRSGPEALRGAMIALMRDKALPGAANPALWAPYMVVSR